MKGITFGSFHSYRDLKLILSKKEIGSPAVKENKIVDYDIISIREIST